MLLNLRRFFTLALCSGISKRLRELREERMRDAGSVWRGGLPYWPDLPRVFTGRTGPKISFLPPWAGGDEINGQGSGRVEEVDPARPEWNML